MNFTDRKRIVQTAFIVIGAVILIAAVWIFFVPFIRYAVFFTLVQKLTLDIPGLPEPIAQAIAALFSIPFIIFGGMLFSFKSKKRTIGFAGLMGFTVIYSLFVYFYTKDFCYGRDGKPNQYVVTPLCEIRFYSSGNIDPEYGLPLKKANTDVIVAYKWLKGQRANALGQNLQFCRESSGRAEMYEMPFQPNSCEIIPLCKREQLERYKKQVDKATIEKQGVELIDQAVRESEAQNFSAALKLLDQAKEISFEDPRLPRARKEISQARKRLQQEWIKTAKEFSKRNRLQEAAGVLEKLLSDDPFHTEAQALLNGIKLNQSSAPQEGEIPEETAGVSDKPNDSPIPVSPGNSSVSPAPTAPAVSSQTKEPTVQNEPPSEEREKTDDGSDRRSGREAPAQDLASAGGNDTLPANLIDAVEKGDKSKAERLLYKASNINATDRQGRTLLMTAAYKGHDELVRLLLLKRAFVDAQCKAGKTALIYASIGGHDATVKVLLEHGANRNLKDAGGLKAVDYAKRNNHNRTEAVLSSGSNK